jgi:hypothetical protein
LSTGSSVGSDCGQGDEGDHGVGIEDGGGEHDTGLAAIVGQSQGIIRGPVPLAVSVLPSTQTASSQ